MSKGLTKAGSKILAGARQAAAHARGEAVKGLIVQEPIDVADVRAATGLSQDKFAAMFALDVTAVRAWEQKTRTPDRAAQLYLRMIQFEPEAVVRTLKRA